MSSCVTSKNVKWCHLIWPTLYVTHTLCTDKSKMDRWCRKSEFWFKLQRVITEINCALENQCVRFVSTKSITAERVDVVNGVITAANSFHRHKSVYKSSRLQNAHYRSSSLWAVVRNMSSWAAGGRSTCEAIRPIIVKITQDDTTPISRSRDGHLSIDFFIAHS